MAPGPSTSSCRILGSAIRLFLVVIVSCGSSWPIWSALVVGRAFGDFNDLGVYIQGRRPKPITDLLQTTFLLSAAGLAVWFIAQELHLDGPGAIWDAVAGSKYSNVVVTDLAHPRHWLKQLLGGMFISMTMTGLDQDMMQKNLTCKTLKDAQKNMLSFSFVLVFVNLLFLALGVLLYMYGTSKGYVVENFADKAAPLQYLNPATGLMEGGKTDRLFPFLTFNYLPVGIGGFYSRLFAAAYASADSALTALTTSFL
ncbi:MAG: hypothetical protein IPN95_19450 [Bacteroidetes bacterium]|nr:hypothetical protein [Bacteroidota bacterium]